MLKRVAVEIGMGTDIRGADYTKAAVRALRAPEIRERMNQIGFDVVANSPEEFGAFMKAEVERWTRVVERGGIKAE